MVSMQEKFANQASHVLGEVISQQLSLFVCLFVGIAGCWLALVVRLKNDSLQQFCVDCQIQPVSLSLHEKAKVQPVFPFPSIFLKFGVPFRTFKRSRKTRKRSMKTKNSQNIGFSFSFWRPPTKEHQKGKCNQVWKDNLTMSLRLAVTFFASAMELRC